jgi:hypothetical protein
MKGLSWLDQRTLAQLTPAAISEFLEEDPPRVVLYTYRLTHLPEQNQKVLQAAYFHVGSRLFVPAPLFSVGKGSVAITHPGLYRLLLEDSQVTVRINGKKLGNNDSISLASGEASFESSCRGRLVLWSEDHAFQAIVGNPPVSLFGDTYIF